MLTKPSNLKGLIAILVFIALYASYNIPGGGSIKKVVQVISLSICVLLMLVIMRNPAEANKKVLNITLIILLIASTIGFYLS